MTQVAKRTMRNAWRLWRSRCLFTFAVAGLSLLTFAFGCSGAKGTMPAAPSDQSSLVSRAANNPPSAPTILWPRNGVTFTGGWYGFFCILQASDSDNDTLKYKIVLKQSGQVAYTFDQTQNSSGWYGTSSGGYPSGMRALFLSGFAGVQVRPGTYQLEAQAFDGKEWGPVGPNPHLIFTYR